MIMWFMSLLVHGIHNLQSLAAFLLSMPANGSYSLPVTDFQTKGTVPLRVLLDS